MRRNLALITLISTLFTCLFGFGDPLDPLTLMVSNNSFVILLKVLAAGLVYFLVVSLNKGTRTQRRLLSLAGGAVVGFCLWTLASAAVLSQLYNYLRLLDILLIMEA